MQKNKFEKQVQQKMEELKLQPSEAVWQNIESRIAATRRRKRGWIFFPLLLICLLCGGYFLYYEAKDLRIKPQGKSAKNSVEEKSIDSHNNELAQKAGKDADITTIAKPGKPVKNAIKAGKDESASIVKEVKVPGAKSTAANFSSKNSEKNIRENLKVMIGPAVAESIDNKKPADEITQDEKKGNTEILIQADQPAIVTKGDTLSIEINSDSLGKNEHQKKAGIAHEQPVVIVVKITKAWKWGLTFSGGISGIPNNFLGSLDKSYSAADALNLSYPPQNNLGLLPSKIESSGALIAGVFAEKSISKKTMITIGLNYKSYNLTSTVGERNVSYPGRDSYSLSNPVNNYRNHFHFIELPVSLKARISYKKIPVFWEAGISASQLISSNALQFDNSSVFYYQKNSLFNKRQIGFNTGLSASFFSKQKASVLIGPYISYGTGKIASAGLYKNQHFTFIGLKTQMHFKK